MNYQKYRTEDFICDEFFIKWIKSSDAATDEFWKKWLADHPGKAGIVQEAKAFVLAINFPQKTISGQQIGSIFNDINQSIAEMPVRGRIKKLNVKRRQAVAVSIVPFLGLFGLYEFSGLAQLKFHTEYNQTQSLSLPDGSSVILNANSSLSSPKKWMKNKDREVWLEGEAFFSVNPHPLNGKKKFVVHTKNADVEVVGTQFNVNSRGEKVRILLTEGKIKVHFRQNRAGKPEPAKPLEMKPGELAEYVKGNPGFNLKRVNTAVYAAWTSNKIVFDNTPLSELVEIIKNNYGYEVLVGNPAVLDEKLSGTLPSNNFEVLLKAINTIFGIKVSELGDKKIAFDI